jgi:hypothetical protein
MKKPLLVRLIGWAGWGFCGLLCVVFYGIYTEGPKPSWGLGLILFGGGMFASWGVWTIASAIVWILRKQAATTAEVVRDATRPPVSDLSEKWRNATRRWFCVTHRQWLSIAEVGNHDTLECMYCPDTPVRHLPARTPAEDEPITTSPLGLNRLK